MNRLSKFTLPSPPGALFESGEHSTAELADLFGVARSTVCRAEQRHLVATRA